MKHGWLNVRMRGAAVSAMALTVVTPHVSAQLTQTEMANIDKLVQQPQLADNNLQREAGNWLMSAGRAAREKRWDLATKMYGEATVRHPTFITLSKRGLAIAKSSRQRDALPETLNAYQATCTAAAQTLQLALAFSEEVPGQAKLQNEQALRVQMESLASYQASAATRCEPVAQVLKRYAVKSSGVEMLLNK